MSGGTDRVGTSKLLCVQMFQEQTHCGATWSAQKGSVLGTGLEPPLGFSTTHPWMDLPQHLMCLLQVIHYDMMYTDFEAPSPTGSNLP